MTYALEPWHAPPPPQAFIYRTQKGSVQIPVPQTDNALLWLTVGVLGTLAVIELSKGGR
jgi:hypothetical protein